jgi:hypothetical protein
MTPECCVLCTICYVDVCLFTYLLTSLFILLLFVSRSSIHYPTPYITHSLHYPSPRPPQYAYKLRCSFPVSCMSLPLAVPNIHFLQHFMSSWRNIQTASRHALTHTLLKLYIRCMKFIGSHTQEKLCFSLTNQRCTNFPKIWERPPNSRRQKGESGYLATPCTIYWRWRFGAGNLFTPEEGQVLVTCMEAVAVL